MTGGRSDSGPAVSSSRCMLEKQPTRGDQGEGVDSMWAAGRYPWEIARKYAWVTISMADYFEMRAKFEKVQGFAPEPGAEAFNFELGGLIITTTASGGL